MASRGHFRVGEEPQDRLLESLRILGRHRQAEVLLLDLGLPGIDGYEIASALRADAAFNDALFVAISGYALSTDKARALASGFDHHCAKPVDFASLIDVINSKYAKIPG